MVEQLARQHSHLEQAAKEAANATLVGQGNQRLYSRFKR